MRTKVKEVVKSLIRDNVRALFGAFGFDSVRRNLYKGYREYILFHLTLTAAKQ